MLNKKFFLPILIIIILAFLIYIGSSGTSVQDSVTGQYRYDNGYYANLTHHFQFKLPANWTEIKGTEGCGGPVFAPQELQTGGSNAYEQKWFTDYGWVTVCGPYPAKDQIIGLATSTEEGEDKRAQRISLPVPEGVMQIYFYQTGADNQTEKENIFNELIDSLEME